MRYTTLSAASFGVKVRIQDGGAGYAVGNELQAQGYPVRPEDMTRLSPFVSRHLGVHGAYSFLLPDLAPGAIRDLRDPEASEDDDDET